MTHALRATASLLGAALILASTIVHAGSRPTLQVGSKRFTESYILAEIAVALGQTGGDADLAHQQGLGGTALLYRALEEGSIDLYPEYTGTIAEAILHTPGTRDIEAMRQALAPRGISLSAPLGFDNTYAIAVPAAIARDRHLTRISDLATAPLTLGLSPEFLGRSDGWPGLSARYDLGALNVQALDHGLAYEAIRQGSIQGMDVYSTDAKLKRFDLTVLTDDRHFFPAYEAVLLYRTDLPARAPKTFSAMTRMVGQLDASTMIDLNGQAELDGKTFRAVAEDFCHARFATTTASSPASAKREGLLAGVLTTLRTEGPRHLGLTFGALLLSVLLGLPLGILASGGKRTGRALLSAAGVIQTIPSLALLCFLIPLLGTGLLPALVALFLYGLLPIARNTAAGLDDIPAPLLESAEALGLSPRDQLLSIKLPLASRTILAGIKTTAIINVGTATLAAFIGAGGFGAPISTGLNLNDTTLILQGAIPAAGLSLLCDGLFSLLDRWLIPKGLRLSEPMDAT
ncbi:MAG: glycine betaine ABC transporter substrate-binding protein [Byssovorax sp.]